jgi:hypothetical protein
MRKARVSIPSTTKNIFNEGRKVISELIKY